MLPIRISGEWAILCTDYPSSRKLSLTPIYMFGALRQLSSGVRKYGRRPTPCMQFVSEIANSDAGLPICHESDFCVCCDAAYVHVFLRRNAHRVIRKETVALNPPKI